MEDKQLQTLAEEFLKKRTKQKDTLCITKGEAISGLTDFAKLIIENNKVK